MCLTELCSLTAGPEEASRSYGVAFETMCTNSVVNAGIGGFETIFRRAFECDSGQRQWCMAPMALRFKCARPVSASTHVSGHCNRQLYTATAVIAPDVGCALQSHLAHV